MQDPAARPDVAGQHELDAELIAHARHVLELVARLSGLHSTYLTSIDWEQELQDVVVSHNTGSDMVMPEGIVVPWEHTFCRRAMEAQLTSTDDLQARFPDCWTAEAMAVRTFVTVPVYGASGDIYGTLCGIGPDRTGVSTDVEATMVALAELITLQLRDRAASREINRQAQELAAANHRLQELALTDELTGLPNRRALLEGLDRMCAAARRRDSPLSVIWIDVDHFKDINDDHGHHAGDEALRLVAKNLAGVIRGSDLAGRMGGDEFVVVLPDTDEAGATALAERVRGHLAAVTDTAFGPVSISAGVACGDGRRPEAVLVAADQALYAAKDAGRGRVRVT